MGLKRVGAKPTCGCGCGNHQLSELQTGTGAAQFVSGPILLGSNPLDPEYVIKLAAPWGTCLYPQTGLLGLPASRLTLAPQMGVDGRDW